MSSILVKILKIHLFRHMFSFWHIVDARFDSRPGRCRVKTLGKFLTPVCNVVLYNII